MTQNVVRHMAQGSVHSPAPPPLPGEGEEVLRPASPSHALGRLSKGRKKVSLSSQNVASSSCSSYSDLALAPFSRTSEEK